MKQPETDKTPTQTIRNRSETREPGIDLQFAELIETVSDCERTWNRNDRIDSAIKYGR